MNIETKLYEDLEQIASHILFRPSEEAVKKWSAVECDDYELPLMKIASFLRNAVPPLSELEIPIKDTPYHRVILDIFRNSALNSLVEIDPAGKFIRYSDTVPASTRAEISDFFHSRGLVLPNYGR